MNSEAVNSNASNPKTPVDPSCPIMHQYPTNQTYNNPKTQDPAKMLKAISKDLKPFSLDAKRVLGDINLSGTHRPKRFIVSSSKTTN